MRKKPKKILFSPSKLYLKIIATLGPEERPVGKAREGIIISMIIFFADPPPFFFRQPIFYEPNFFIATLGPEERPVGRPERHYYQSATHPANRLLWNWLKNMQELNQIET